MVATSPDADVARDLPPILLVFSFVTELYALRQTALNFKNGRL
jgi:hypothetical protein